MTEREKVTSMGIQKEGNGIMNMNRSFDKLSEECGIFGIVTAGAAILELGGGLAAVRIPLPPVAVAVVAAVVLVGAWLVSYRLSCRIYENREF